MCVSAPTHDYDDNDDEANGVIRKRCNAILYDMAHKNVTRAFVQ